MRSEKEVLPSAGSEVYIGVDEVDTFGAWNVDECGEQDIGGEIEPIVQRVVLTRRVERPE